MDKYSDHPRIAPRKLEKVKAATKEESAALESTRKATGRSKTVPFILKVPANQGESAGKITEVEAAASTKTESNDKAAKTATAEIARKAVENGSIVYQENGCLCIFLP